MAGSYTRWYREGTVKAVKNSAVITGSNTFWLTAGINPGDIFSLDGVNDYEVLSVTDNNTLTLKSPYLGGNVSGAAYHIIRNFTAHMPSQIAAMTAALYNSLLHYWEQDTQTLTGKSAYDVACDEGYAGNKAQWLASLIGKSAYEIAVQHGFSGNESAWIDSLKGLSAYDVAKKNGYTGTESQWLESLKAAGEISAIKSELEPISIHNPYAHNAIYGGRNLGTTITAEQIANVRKGTFKGLYPGDFWQLAVDGTTIMEIAGCDLYNTPIHPHQLIVTLRNESWQYPMNDTLTCEGHLTGMSLFNEVFPALVEKIEAVIDPSYIQNTQDYQATGINAEGKVTTRGYPYSKLFLPSCQNLNIKDTEDPNNQAYSIYSNVVWPRFMHNPKLPWSWDASHDHAWLDANLTDKAWMVARSRLRIAGSSIVTNTCYVFPYMFII